VALKTDRTHEVILLTCSW